MGRVNKIIFGLKGKKHPTPPIIKKIADSILYGLGGGAAIATIAGFYPQLSGILTVICLLCKMISNYFGHVRSY